MADIKTMLAALLIGMAFGATLSLSGAASHRMIVNALRLKDLRLLKIILTALGVGMLGVNLLDAAGMAHLKIKPAYLLGVVLGGVLFGIGFALAGYCPGTCVVATAERKKDALFVLLGGLLGATTFGLIYPAVKPFLIDTLNFGEVRVPDLLGGLTADGIGGALPPSAGVGFPSPRKTRANPSSSLREGSSGEAESVKKPMRDGKSQNREVKVGMGEVREFCEIPMVNAGDEEIERLLKEAKVIAVVGVSRDPTKDSHIVAKYLSQHYRTYFINPNAEEIDGHKVYPSLKDLPEVPDIVDIFRAPSKVPPIVDEAIEVGAKAVWMQLGIVNNEAAQKAKEAGLTVVQNRCIMVEHKRLKAAGKL